MADGSDQESLTFKIGPEYAGVRLDTFLASQVPGWSRARLQRLIEAEDVFVNGKLSKPSYKLREHDELEVELTTPTTTSFAPEAIPIEIVHEDDTSGLLVVAKTESALENLSDQFRARSVYKSYVALVHGRVQSDSGRIEQPLARDPSNRTRMAVVRGGRSALSIYRVNLRFNRFTLLDVELKTGRTHQIRVHLAWLKHPVVGDETYGGGRDNTIQDPKLRASIRNLNRHFLHAEKLGFTHPKSG